MEQVWRYEVNTLPGQVFSTVQQAEAAMRGVNLQTSLLQLATESASDKTIYKNYDVPVLGCVDI